jgi:hypothetical protein
MLRRVKKGCWGRFKTGRSVRTKVEYYGHPVDEGWRKIKLNAALGRIRLCRSAT